MKIESTFWNNKIVIRFTAPHAGNIAVRRPNGDVHMAYFTIGTNVPGDRIVQFIDSRTFTKTIPPSVLAKIKHMALDSWAMRNK